MTHEMQPASVTGGRRMHNALSVSSACNLQSCPVRQSKEDERILVASQLVCDQRTADAPPTVARHGARDVGMRRRHEGSQSQCARRLTTRVAHGVRKPDATKR